MGRRALAFVILTALLAANAPAQSAPIPQFTDARARRALALLDGQTCAARVAALQTTPTPAPTATSTPAFPGGGPQPGGQIFATPFPTGAPVTPPPVPTPTPAAHATNPPVYVTNGSPQPVPTVTPVGQTPPPGALPATPTPAPSAAPTLGPGEIAITADKLRGGMKPGQPGDAIGNVHIFYANEMIAGDRAHYDGIETITITGHPYVINTNRDSIYYAKTIVFDTISQTATLTDGRGESSQGVEKGLVYFTSKDLHSTSSGVAHGDYVSLTTCERPRAGYHFTARTMDVHPGDRIVLSKVVLWLGAAAIFYLPKVIIPLRQVVNQTRRPSFFPEVGYNQFQGYYVKVRDGFGKDRYYYGYYRVEFFSKVGLGLGYVGHLRKHNGKRSTDISYYGIHDRRIGQSTYNLTLADVENFGQTLRGNFNFAYNSNFGALTSVPPTTSISGTVAHTRPHESQSYTFTRNAVGSQSSTLNFGFGDNRQFKPNLTNALNFTLSTSQTSYGTFVSSSTATLADLLHWSTPAAQYQLTYNKAYTNTPYGVNKVPELQILPLRFFRHFVFPLASQFTIGEYSEPSHHFATQRADLSFVLGPALANVFGSAFNATVTVDQYAYGTGDLKAAIRQNMSLNTPLGNHIVNSITYSESNYNGPAFVPFQTLDLLPTSNYKTAQDVLRFFNSDYYNLALNFGTAFNRMAQPVAYQLTLRPSLRSYAIVGGSFTPGPGQGFFNTNLQFITPFGRGGTLQFAGTFDWKNKGRIENKNIYYSHIIGECYQVNVQYNEALKSVNVTLDILAFPSHAANFGISAQAPLVGSGSLNF